MTEQNDALKPCPFCGGQGHVNGSEKTFGYVCCKTCGACSMVKPYAETIIAWNTRADHIEAPAEGEVREAVEVMTQHINDVQIVMGKSTADYIKSLIRAATAPFKHKPSCYKSNPSPQAAAENDCQSCPYENECRSKSSDMSAPADAEVREVFEWLDQGGWNGMPKRMRETLIRAVTARQDDALFWKRMYDAQTDLLKKSEDVIKQQNVKLAEPRQDDVAAKLAEALRSIKTEAEINHSPTPPAQVMGNLLGFIEDMAGEALAEYEAAREIEE